MRRNDKISTSFFHAPSLGLRSMPCGLALLLAAAFLSWGCPGAQAAPLSEPGLLLADKKGEARPLVPQYIGEERARNIALSHAGVEPATVTSFKLKLDRDDGQYEIEFRSNGFEYEYEIDARSGRILEFEKEQEWLPGKPGGQGGLIGEERARSIATSHAGVGQDARILNIHSYSKRGVVLYEVIFLTGNKKYRYEVDAHSGEVVHFYTHRR